MFPHYLYVVEDGAVRLHALPDAVLQRLQWDAELEAVLYERLPGRIIDYVLLDAQAFAQTHNFVCDVLAEIIVGVLVAEIQLPIFPHPTLDDRPCFLRYGETHLLVTLLRVLRFLPDVFYGGTPLEINLHQVYEIDASQVVGEHEEVASHTEGFFSHVSVTDEPDIFHADVQFVHAAFRFLVIFEWMGVIRYLLIPYGSVDDGLDMYLLLPGSTLCRAGTGRSL